MPASADQVANTWAGPPARLSILGQSNPGIPLVQEASAGFRLAPARAGYPPPLLQPRRVSA